MQTYCSLLNLFIPDLATLRVIIGVYVYSCTLYKGEVMINKTLILERTEVLHYL